MGLLLSLLVTCVGVVELLAFYSNVTRSLVTVYTRPSLLDLNKRYQEDFERHKKSKHLANSDTNGFSVYTNNVSYDKTIVGNAKVNNTASCEGNESEIRSKSLPPHSVTSDELAGDDKVSGLYKSVDNKESDGKSLTHFENVHEKEGATNCLSIRTNNINYNKTAKITSSEDNESEITPKSPPVHSVTSDELAGDDKVSSLHKSVDNKDSDGESLRHSENVDEKEGATNCLSIRTNNINCNKTAKIYNITSSEGNESEITPKSPPLHSLASVDVIGNGSVTDFQKCVDKKESDRKSLTCFVNKDEKEAPIALPKPFTVTPQETETVASTKEERSRSPSPIPKSLEGQEVTFTRSPSPYPSLVLSVPRNSVSSELLDNPILSIVEVDEERLSKSPTPEKVVQILERSDNITEQKTNNILQVPSINARSRSPECNRHPPVFDEGPGQDPVDLNSNLNHFLQSAAESIHFDTNDVDNEGFFKEYNEQFLDSLDGVNKKKITRNNATRKSRKKKISPSVSTESKAYF